jgi:hypothetical protein
MVLVLIGLLGVPLLFALATVRERPRRERASQTSRDARLNLLSLAKRWRSVLPFYLVLACAAVSDFSIGTWTPALLSCRFG